MFTCILAGEINCRLPFGVTCPIIGWVQGLSISSAPFSRETLDEHTALGRV